MYENDTICTHKLWLIVNKKNNNREIEVVAMALKSEYKSELIKSFKNVRVLSNIDIENEEKVIKIIDQLAETLFECQYNNSNCPGYEAYQKYKIKKQLEKERNAALELKFKVIGTFH